jgi:hypothetical protein
MTRLPQLEYELVAAAGRLKGPRRVVAPATRAALAAAAVLAAAVVAVLVATGGDGTNAPSRATGAEIPFPPNATLEDMLGVFRRPATPADDMGVDEKDVVGIADLQPGEDPTRSRRIDWPEATVFLWPMRDGVCNGVTPKRGHGSGSGCVPLDHLRRQGVSVGIHASGGPEVVSGVAIDGIDEVVLGVAGGPDVHVPVRDNTFALVPGPGASQLRWSYAGEQRSFDLSRILGKVAPSPPAPRGTPNSRIDPLAESVSPPLEFTVGGTRYTALGFHSSRTMVCTMLRRDPGDVPAGSSCLSERLLRDALAERPAHLFAGGDDELTGFARADVADLTAPGSATVVLSEPWRPEPWNGEPIRFFYVFGAGRMHTPLEATLSDGRTVEVP